MNKVKEKIEELLKKGENLSEQDVCSLLSWSKRAIESMTQVEREKFAVLKMYCDWQHHPVLDESKVGFKALAAVNRVLNEEKTKADNDNLIRAVSESIGLSALKAEFCVFLGTLGINVDPFDSMWRVFVGHLLELIDEVPLVFPTRFDESRKRIKAEIESTPLKEGMWVISAKPISLFGIRYLEILTSDTTRLMIPVTIV